MKKMENMGGFFVAAITPFDENGKFNLNSSKLIAYSHGEYKNITLGL